MKYMQHKQYGYVVRVDAFDQFGQFSGTVVRSSPPRVRVPPDDTRTLGQRLTHWRVDDFVPSASK